MAGAALESSDVRQEAKGTGRSSGRSALVDSIEEELFAAEARRHDAEVCCSTHRAAPVYWLYLCMARGLA